MLRTMKHFLLAVLLIAFAGPSFAASATYGVTVQKIVNAYYTGKTVKAMLLTSSYTPDADAHDFVDDIVAFEASGTGYTAGGQTVTATITLDTATNQVRVTFTAPVWTSSSVGARYLALYFDIGTNSQDELITVIDNGSTVTSSNSTFTFDITAPLVFTY
ncbi:hypothetical protein HPT27_10555 [Permianibacter sp. IMCC34836]|uniref:hypothetical protein n=1 Tax=Permianibacter fluminis TaxID=2738515 RepID=UPI00155174DF|nr:hypothetical protein [Permianibacter fluminis]NQD37468.1 hypothetical protein [Permianibacter fluminis]